MTGDTERQADVRKCGAGMGEACCAFLCVDAEGAFCARADDAASMIIVGRVAAGLMTAQYLPDAPYPECQPPIVAADEGATGEHTTNDE